jgi:hypothetical protein
MPVLMCPWAGADLVPQREGHSERSLLWAFVMPRHGNFLRAGIQTLMTESGSSGCLFVLPYRQVR